MLDFVFLSGGERDLFDGGVVGDRLLKCSEYFCMKAPSTFPCGAFVILWSNSAFRVTASAVFGDVDSSVGSLLDNVCRISPSIILME